MLIDQTVSAFTDELASASPAPGGGSVAALSGALGAALTSMVCRLTVGKKKYAAVEEEMKALLERAEEYRSALAALVDRDTEAFTGVMNAYALPKESDEQKHARSEAIQEAMKQAVRVPLEVMRLCAAMAALTAVVEEKGNTNSLTDAGVAMLMLEAASRGAAFNVKVNLASITDRVFTAGVAGEIKKYDEAMMRLTAETLERVDEKLQPRA